MEWLRMIADGFRLYGKVGVLTILPCILFALFVSRKINVVRFVFVQAFVLYLCCVYCLVLTPPENFVATGLRFQVLPFYWVYDMITKPCMHTILCVIFNIVMTVPFGMFLTYVFGCNKKKVVLLSLALTICIELTQLTGCFGIFPVSYRLCDMDDLITNTLGGFLGYVAVAKAGHILPVLSTFDAKLPQVNVMNMESMNK